MKRLTTIVLVLLLALSFAACDNGQGSFPESAADTAPPNTASTVKFVGLDSDVSFSTEDIMAFEAVTADVVSVNSSGTEKNMTVTGAKLSDILTTLDFTQTDFTTVTTEADDGYKIVIPSEILEARDILLVYEVDGEACAIRTVIPDERAMYWTKNLVTISFEAENTVDESDFEVDVAEVVFLNTALQTQTSVPYDYKGETDQAVAIKGWFSETPTADIYAADGLVLTHDWATLEQCYLKYTGEDALYLGSPDIAKGMTVKNVAYIRCGTTVYAELNGIISLFGENANAAEILTTMGLLTDSVYVFTASDGYEVTINATDLAKGNFRLMDDGTVRIDVDGLEKSTTVKGLISVRVG